MICEYCGSAVKDGAKFCESCGAKLTAGGNSAPVMQPYVSAQTPGVQPGQPSEGNMPGGAGYNMPGGFGGNTSRGSGGRYVTKNIVQGRDGKYRWIYELSLYKNPTVLITLFKVLAISMGVLFLVLLIASGFDFGSLIIMGIMLGIFVVLGTISYFIYAAFVGGKYIVVFEMGEEEIVHAQAPQQFKKMQKMAAGMGVIGALSGNLNLLGQSLYLGNTDSRTSVYKDVRSIKSVRKRNVIYGWSKRDGSFWTHALPFSGYEPDFFVRVRGCTYAKRSCAKTA